MGTTISADWLTKLAIRLENVMQRLKRIHFKSLGGLLAFQEKLADEWRAVAAAETSGSAMPLTAAHAEGNPRA